MDHANSAVLDLKVIDKRQTGGKSPNMEPLAFQKCLEYLKDTSIIIEEVVTDQHISIISFC